MHTVRTLLCFIVFRSRWILSISPRVTPLTGFGAADQLWRVHYELIIQPQQNKAQPNHVHKHIRIPVCSGQNHALQLNALTNWNTQHHCCQMMHISFKDMLGFSCPAISRPVCQPAKFPSNRAGVSLRSLLDPFALAACRRRTHGAPMKTSHFRWNWSWQSSSMKDSGLSQ